METSGDAVSTAAFPQRGSVVTFSCFTSLLEARRLLVGNTVRKVGHTDARLTTSVQALRHVLFSLARHIPELFHFRRARFPLKRGVREDTL